MTDIKEELQRLFWPTEWKHLFGLNNDIMSTYHCEKSCIKIIITSQLIQSLDEWGRRKSKFYKLMEATIWESIPTSSVKQLSLFKSIYALYNMLTIERYMFLDFLAEPEVQLSLAYGSQYGNASWTSLIVQITTQSNRRFSNNFWQLMQITLLDFWFNE